MLQTKNKEREIEFQKSKTTKTLNNQKKNNYGKIFDRDTVYIDEV
jgi:hypothetical protein